MEETETSTKARGTESRDAAGRPGKPSPDSASPEANNSIRRSRRRLKAATKSHESPESPAQKKTHDRAREPASPGPSERVIPDHIRKRFVQVGHRYHFPDGAHAFTDRGGRLVTPSENAEVVKSLIAIAEARGWKEITVTGTERFRKEAWAAGSVLGLKVRGYAPTEFERAHLARKLAREAGGSPASADEPARAAGDRGAATEGGVCDRPKGPIMGRLIDHGVAAYRHDPHEPISYVVKIDTPEGEREIWGVDLKRALKESLTQPKIGDDIALRAVRRDTVTVQERKRDPDGKVVGQKPLDAHRNRWIVEKQEFFAERAAAARTLRDPKIDPKQAARRHPELVGTYLQMHAAQIAARQFRDPQDREKFVSHVRTALADAIARGEPLPSVRLKQKVAVPTPTPETIRGEEAPTR
ncbi:MAG: LPD7 domain-containing protein [Steroidobacteraceae bacterium]